MFVLFNFPSPLDLLAASAKPNDLWQAHADGDTLEIYSTRDAEYVASLSDDDPEGAQDPVPHLNREESAPNDMINGRERLVPGDFHIRYHLALSKVVLGGREGKRTPPRAGRQPSC